jgi:3-oxoacyl-[acyl-carrier-protein] synthase-1/3-oxoacyl-[acyl-carrier-protein] synthase II
LGTGWGALSETSDFLTRLFETNEQFPSPIDFIGSVHNAAAGQIAMRFQATGPNITMTGGDYSFEQALMAASLLSNGIEDTFLVIGADESHPQLSRLFDPSASGSAILSDGGGALCLKTAASGSGITIQPVFFETGENNPEVISSLVEHLGQPQQINDRYGMILAGIPAACRHEGEMQLNNLVSLSGFTPPVIDYRKITGEHASASAVAAAMAVRFLQNGKIPEALCRDKSADINQKGVLIIGTGRFITALEVMPK